MGIRLPDWLHQRHTIIRGFVDYIKRHHLRWRLIGNEPNAFELEEVTLDENWKGDAILVYRCTREESEQWESEGITVVNLSSETPHPNLINLIPDDLLLGRTAAQHLEMMGLSHYIYVGDPNRQYSARRWQGFSQYLEASNITAFKYDIPVSQTPITQRPQTVRQHLEKICEKLQPASGIFLRDDMLARHMLSIMLEREMEVPKDYCVMGCGNNESHCNLSWPTLTSVHYPAHQAGYAAAEQLHNAFNGKTPHTPSLPSDSVCERSSTAVYAKSDSLVNQAITIITERCDHETLSVRDIAKELGVSYSQLRQKFSQATGRTVRSEIVRVRVERIKDLLTTTSLSLDDIARNMGYSSTSEFSRFVQREIGTSPRRFRLKHQT
ncbi:substrate-binding domain-containing protein [Rubritalea tangerina]|uniref:AraC family transcriptional regulator n=1 Tax=Rubritalea tangerina TaxID=430798 RepID=UPI00361976A2